MKKLKTKVFAIIFCILTLFVVAMFATVNIQNHNARHDIQIAYDESFNTSTFAVKPPDDTFSDVLTRNLSFSPLAIFVTFTLFELLVAVIAQLLTKWVTDPVQRSFEKQKQFLADASHELKTPIAVLLASSDAYAKDGDKKWLKNMRSETERMSELVKDLLDLSQLENEAGTNFEETDLSNLVESAVLTTESLFFESGIELDYKITPNLKLRCNQAQIKQLVSILIDNALTHAEKKSKVKIILEKDGKNLCLSVKNQGKPIPKGEEDKIFERLYRSDKARNRDEHHYGLGLAIAKTIVENHHGEISASSKAGFTTFRAKFVAQK